MKRLLLWFLYCRKCSMYKAKWCKCEWFSCSKWQKYCKPELYKKNKRRIESAKK